MTQLHLTMIDAAGIEHRLTATPGQNVMEVAVANNIEGIEAECGGACSCATCHVYVALEWAERIGPPAELEGEMLDFAEAERRDTSRLSCQIRLVPELDGLRVEVAAG